MGSADDRRFEVLRAIVADFVSTKEPIGSKTLVERHNLGVSSATVRNDMAVLEAEGYITQPHTSSGRVPTEKGYREFVDRLDDIKPLSSSERRAILSFLESGVDLDDVLRRAVRLLAQLTRQVAVVQYPTLSTSNVRHLEVVALTPAKLLLVVITDSGRVDQRTVELGDAIDEHQLAQLRERLGQALEGKPLAAASVAVSDLAAHLDGSGGAWRCHRPVGDGSGGVAGRAQRGTTPAGRNREPDPQHRRLRRFAAVGAGSARGAGRGAAAAGSAAGRPGKVTVRIGHETEAEQMAGTSVVSTVYGSSGKVYGGMGVLGPTRMDYPGTIANVAAVALYIGEVLGSR